VSSETRDKLRLVGGLKTLVDSVAAVEKDCLYAVLRALTVLASSLSNQDEFGRINGLQDISSVLRSSDEKGIFFANALLPSIETHRISFQLSRLLSSA
jgi:hypothetical protein